MNALKLNPLTYEFKYEKEEDINLFLCSDIHFDNPHCKRDLFFDHLKRIRDKGGKAAINGDLFCFMQGKYDPRRSKGDIRPEHNKSNYIDAVIDDTVDKLSPYKDVIIFINEGNHETAITKNVETNVLDRFVDKYNWTNKTNVLKGGYRGWIILRKETSNGIFLSYKIYFNHGYGGGGEVTKGIIQHYRMNNYIEGADAIWMGHVHECYVEVSTVEFFDNHHSSFRPKDRQIFNVRTSAYKEEFIDTDHGYHIEKGRRPKTLGGIFLNIDHTRDSNESHKLYPTYTIWT